MKRTELSESAWLWLWLLLVVVTVWIIFAGCGHDHIYRPTAQAPVDTCGIDDRDDD